MSDDNYPKEAGFRDLMLVELGGIVDDILIKHQRYPKHVFTQTDPYAFLLTICIERCISFGIRAHSLFKKRSFFLFLEKGSSTARDENLRRDFNAISILLLSNEGKGRAWIRRTLTQQHLASSIYSFASDRTLVNAWYEPYAIMTTNAVNDLYKHISDLEGIMFNFSLKDSVLDDNDRMRTNPSLYRSRNNIQRLRKEDELISLDVKKKKKKKKRKIQKSKIENIGQMNEHKIAYADDQSLSESLSNSPYSHNSPSLKYRMKSRKKSNSNSHSHSISADLLFISESTVDTNTDSILSRIMHEQEKKAISNAEETNEMKHENSERNDNNYSSSEWQSKNIVNVQALSLNSTRSVSVNTNLRNIKRSSPRIINKPGLISNSIRSKLPSINFHKNSPTKEKIFPCHSPCDPLGKGLTFKSKKSNLDNILREEIECRKLFPDPNIYKTEDSNEDEFEDDEDIEDAEKLLQDLMNKVPDNDENDEEFDVMINDESSDSFEHKTENVDEQNINSQENVFCSPNETVISNTSTSSSTLDKRVMTSIIDSDSTLVNNSDFKTYVHFSHETNRRSGEKSLAIFLQNDDYFLSENKIRDQRKLQQDKKSKLRMQLEQEVLRGNDNQMRKLKKSSIVDNNGDRLILPSTGIILDSITNATKELLFSSIFLNTFSKNVKFSFNLFVQKCQNGLCFSCGDYLGSAQISRQCLYSQRLYCTLCMDGSDSFHIPYKIINNLDIKKYQISFNSKKHLQQMYIIPTIPLSKIIFPKCYQPSNTPNAGNSAEMQNKLFMYSMDTSLKKKSGNANNISNIHMIENFNEKYYKIIKLAEYLEILSYIKSYYYRNKECKDIYHIIKLLFGNRKYLLDAYSTDKESFGYYLQLIDDGFIVGDGGNDDVNVNTNVKGGKYRVYGLVSMRDMNELFNKNLLEKLEISQKRIVQHIKQCVHCKKCSYGANGAFISKFPQIFQ